MLPFSFWKPDFLVQEYSDSDEKKKKKNACVEDSPTVEKT